MPESNEFLKTRAMFSSIFFSSSGSIAAALFFLFAAFLSRWKISGRSSLSPAESFSLGPETDDCLGHVLKLELFSKKKIF